MTPLLSHKKQVHFIGIGGIGVSSLAQWFLAQNWAVSGSDLKGSKITQELQKKGVKVKIGHKVSNLSPKTALVIHSAAIPADNPELRKAKELGKEILTYSQALGRLTEKYVTLAVAGTHGKSTTTAMTAAILIKAGFDPTVILGSKFLMPDLGTTTIGNFRYGRSDFLVIEADEYRDQFLNYSPWAGIITNIELDHLDYFKNLTQAKNSFLKFSERFDPRGFIVLNKDNPVLRQIAPKIKLPIIWFSSRQKERLKKLSRIIKVPGRHNLMNALAAWSLAENMGIAEKDILSCLADFPGIWRRLEYKAEKTVVLGRQSVKVKIFDDYAHHPTEIKASLQGLAEKFPNHYLICVFQPHQVKRLIGLFDEFKTAFSGADSLILLDIYTVAGRDEVSQNITSADLAAEIAKLKNGPMVSYLPRPERLIENIKEHLILAKKNKKNIDAAVVVMMGAGNIADYTPFLLK